MVGRQYHILGCLNHRARGIWITCINFWHIVCITSWFQGTHNMFGFYTAFVVNVIKCRSKYKKYSKRIPTSKTGKMRQIPGQGQYWQQKLSFLVFFFTQNHWTLPHFACFSISIKTLILCILKPTDFSKFYEERFCVNSLVATDKLRGRTLVVEISKHINKICCFLHTWTHLDLIE